MKKSTHTNYFKEKAQMAESENRIKDYVNFLRRKSILDLEEMDKKENVEMKKVIYGSCNNLGIKKVNQNNKEKQKGNKKKRRFSCIEEPRGFLFSSPQNKKINKNKSLKPEFAFDGDSSKKNYESPKKIINLSFSDPQVFKPKKKISSNIRFLKDNKLFQNNHQIQDNKQLLPILKPPAYFEGENNDSDSIVLDNSEKNHLSNLSSKNILQINEITKELRNTFLGKGKQIIEELNKKSFVFDDIDSYEKENNNKNNFTFNKEDYRILRKKGYVYDSFDEEEILDEEIEIYHNFSPESKLIYFIDFMICIFVFYNLLYLPFFLAYNNIYCYTDNYYYSFGNIVEYFIDFVYLLDIIITFFVGFYNFDEILINDYKSIAQNYFKSWFFIDFISAIPIKTLLKFFNKKCYNKDFLNNPLFNHNYYYLLILIRLFKTLKLVFKNKFIQYLDVKLTKFDKFNQYFRLLISLTIFLFSIHLVSCIYIFLGKNEFPNWIIYFNHQDKKFHQIYFISIYYTIATVTTVGYGDLFCTNFSEKIFGLIMEIFGIIAYSWSLTAMINYVKSFTDIEEELCKKLRLLDEIKLNYPQLSEDLYDRISRFLKYKHESEKKDSHIVFDDLPVTLRNTLIYEMYKPMIHSFIFFKNFSNSDFIVKIILALKPILALKNDILIKDGDFVEDIIFVKKGKLSLELPLDMSPQKKLSSVKKPSYLFNQENTIRLSRDNSLFRLSSHLIHNLKKKKLRHLYSIQRIQTIENHEDIQHYRILQIRKNEHFGDILMFLNQRSPLILKVKSKKAELFFLNKSDAINISTIYPQYWKRINKKSLFNMEQIKRYTNKLIKILKNVYGNKAHLKKHIKRAPSVLTGSYIDIIEENNDCDLKSIPTFNDETEINNSIIYDDIKNVCLKNKGGNEIIKTKGKKDIPLKTIVEVENYSSSASFYSSSSSKNHSLSSKNSPKSISDSLSSNFSNANLNNDSFSQKENQKNINTKNEKNEGKNYEHKVRHTKERITPYKKEEINNEIYPEETFIITGGYNPNKNRNSSIKNIFQIQDNISICSTESFSISSEYENIDEISERRYSKDKKLRKKVKTLIKEEISKNKSMNSKSTLSEMSLSDNKDSSPINHSSNRENKKLLKHHNFTKAINEYKKVPSSLNSVPKSIGSDFGFENKNNDENNYFRIYSGGNNLKVNKMLSEDDDKNSQNKKGKDILDVIGHNIEKNVMILNNPEQFYSKFFINMMNKKSNHSNLKKDEIYNSKSVNNIHLKEKVKKKFE